MSAYLLTIAIAFVLMVIALTCLACGWLFTGKARLWPGGCGRYPSKMKDNEKCNTKSSCDISSGNGDKKP